MVNDKPKWLKLTRTFSIILVTLVTVVFFVVAYLVNIPAGDWLDTIRPAVHQLLAGKSPMVVPGFYNPPWALIPLIPVAILPPRVGCAVLAVVSLVSFAFVAIRLGAKPITLAFILLSPPVLQDIHHLNLEWMVALGFVLPPSIGMLLVLVKPQIGVIVAVYYLWEAWSRNGIKGVLKISLPTIIFFALSVIVYGPWFMSLLGAPKSPHNISLWPTAVPVGLVLVVLAIKRHKQNFAILASPFLAPYLASYSLGVPLLGLLPLQIETIICVIGMWLAHFLPAV